MSVSFNITSNRKCNGKYPRVAKSPIRPCISDNLFRLLVVKVSQDKRVINKSIYIELAINLEGKKELLGIWISENEVNFGCKC